MAGMGGMRIYPPYELHTNALGAAMTVRSSIIFMAINASGIAIFLFIASCFWIEPELADVPGANIGSAFGWVRYAVPIPILFIFSDLSWTAVKVAKVEWPHRFRYMSLSLAVLACWATAYAFDSRHHGM
jgi:hypothetical protein